MLSTISEAKRLQIKLSSKVISKNSFPSKIRTVCGVDVSYKGNKAYCSAVILDIKKLELKNFSNVIQNITTPYIPGLFMLRESRPILKAITQLEMNFDLLLVDGHGRLHPRQCGLACFIGIKIDKPVIGVAKNLLCGKIRPDKKIEFEGKVLGQQIDSEKKKLYVSVGHKISLKTSVRIVRELTLKGSWYPEPLRLADLYSKKLRKKFNID